LVWANLCQGDLSVVPSSLFSRVRPFVPALAPGSIGAPRAVTVKGGPLAIAKRLALDGHEHGGSVTLSRQVLFVELYNFKPRGARHQAPVNAPQACMRLILADQKP
ncbi:hypothetical protein, partial [Mesorhizobium sp. M0768]|uniref:hypothetical protein n=1 Tax=Mesorhizobium sp. M0768 TaxID=2956996 RepID=UPI00333CEE43